MDIDNPKDFLAAFAPEDRNGPPIERLLQFFEYDHIDNDTVRGVARPIHDLAWQVVLKLPRNAQRTHVLNNLLQAREAASRAVAYDDNWEFTDARAYRRNFEEA